MNYPASFILLLFLCFNLTNLAQDGTNVKSFAPEIFSQYPAVRDFTIASDGMEAYFTAQSYLGELSVVMRMNYADDHWQPAEVVSFSGRYPDLEPFLESDGLKLWFASKRPRNDSVANDYDIWFVERASKESDWSEAKNLGEPVNSRYNEYYPSLAENGTIYFTSDRSGSFGEDDIFSSVWDGMQFRNPENLGAGINSKGYEYNAFISPDESLILFGGYNRTDGFGSGDIYISYRTKDGKWNRATNLGSVVNSDNMDYCPFVNSTRETMYFTSKRSNLNTAQSYRTRSSLLKEINKYDNGSSRIYQVPFHEVLKATKNFPQ